MYFTFLSEYTIRISDVSGHRSVNENIKLILEK